MEEELKIRIEELTDKLNVALNKIEKMKRSYNSLILMNLKSHCKIIPLAVAKSGIYEEDIEKILGEIDV